MRKVVFLIAIILFIIPFFWVKPGFVDLGGDAGRLYFLDPLTVAKNLYDHQSLAWASAYAILPYELALAVLKKVVGSATTMIAIDRGLQLSLAFYSIYLIVNTLLSPAKQIRSFRDTCAAIVSGIVYVGFVSSSGWALSLETHSQIFLNPLIFYLLLRYCLTSNFIFAVCILLLTLIYSGNFSFSGMPQLAAFYPHAIGFLLIFITRFIRRPVPWRNLFILGILFVGLHAYHIVPTAASLLDKSTFTHSYVFGSQSIQESGVHYFDVNHETLGKISTPLFAPARSPQNLLILFVPMVIFLGLMRSPSVLGEVTGIFFAVTLFLVSANITKIGVGLYQKLFYIPGFMMFRSFNDKWYYVFAFFYVLLFACSFASVIKNRKTWIVAALSLFIIGSTIYRIFPFLQGKAIDVPHYQSKNVSPIFSIDPNLMDTLSVVRTLPEGKILTLPLTFPYYQIAYGKEGGAYVGGSLIISLTGREDYSGFWRFGNYAQKMFDAIHDEDIHTILEILSTLHVRYIFYNSDSRIMDNFPDYPYIYPGLMYSSKDQLPAIRDQAAYAAFLAKFPLKKVYEKGVYSLYEIEYVNPPVFTSSFEVPTQEKQYFTVGRGISIVTAGIMIVLSVWELIWRKYKKK